MKTLPAPTVIDRTTLQGLIELPTVKVGTSMWDDTFIHGVVATFADGSSLVELTSSREVRDEFLVPTYQSLGALFVNPIEVTG